MLSNWLRKFHNKILGRDRTRPRARQERRARLGVECLEERVVLSGGMVPGYTLDNSGNLFHSTASGPQLIDSGVKGFTVVSNQVYDLHRDGTVYQFTANGKAQIGVNAASLVSDATGSVLALNFTDHGVYQHNPAGGWGKVYSDVANLVAGANGTLYYLQGTNLVQYGKGVVASGVNCFAIATDGTVYALRGGILQKLPPGATTGAIWQTVPDVPSNIQWFCLDNSNEVVTLEGGSLYTYTARGKQFTGNVYNAIADAVAALASSVQVDWVAVGKYIYGAYRAYQQDPVEGTGLMKFIADQGLNTFMDLINLGVEYYQATHPRAPIVSPQGTAPGNWTVTRT